jgi:hypothetical protein
MPRGASPKREREYEELVGEFKKEHRYPGREKEVAARIVNKQRAEFGETKEEKQKDREGKSPDRGLPIDNYQHLTIADIKRQAPKLKAADKRKIVNYEKKHKNRKGVLELLGAL